MPDWLLISIVGSVALTLLLNLLPMLFPKASRRARERLIDEMSEHQRRIDAPEPGPRARVFFPWKAMLVGSLVLTVVVNVLGWLAGR